MDNLEFGISKSEYEKERSVFEFCTWLNDKLAELEKLPNFDELYFERKKEGENVKALIEEAIPVSCLALYFLKLRGDVMVICLTGNEPDGDATLTIQEFDSTKRNIKVEVTTTETPESTMRRQSLSWHGFAWGSGPIKREGSRNNQIIVSEPEMVNAREEDERTIQLMYERFLDKVRHGYDVNTAILVYMNSLPSRSISIHMRSKLIQRVQSYLITERPDIYGAYFCYGYDYLIDGIRSELRN